MHWSSQTLHPSAPLQHLLVTGTTYTTGLSGLSRFTGLKSLDFGVSSASAADWQVMSGLPTLHELCLDASSFANLPPDAVLAQVTDLRLWHRNHAQNVQQVINRLPHALPNLRSLGLPGEAALLFDTSPVEAMPTFRNLRINSPVLSRRVGALFTSAHG